MAYCELCDIDLEFCGHGLVERHTNAAATTRQLLISPNGTANSWRLPAESAPESPAGRPQRPPSSLSGRNVDRGPGKVAVVPWCQGMRFSRVIRLLIFFKARILESMCSSPNPDKRCLALPPRLFGRPVVAGYQHQSTAGCGRFPVSNSTMSVRSARVEEVTLAAG